MNCYIVYWSFSFYSKPEQQVALKVHAASETDAMARASNHLDNPLAWIHRAVRHQE